MAEAPTQKDPWATFAEQIGAKLDADVIVYSGAMDDQGADRVIRLSKSTTRRKNVFLLLTTRGGSADAAFRLCRCLQNHYDKLILYIYGMCKSAGTLVAVGAHEIVLSDYGEFGPLDVQLGKTDEIFENTSGLDVTQALVSLEKRTFEFFRTSLLNIRIGTKSQVSTRLASELATKLSVGVYSPIFGQIDPIQLGATERALRIAIRYGERLKQNTKNLKESALERLATSYPSHGFVIDLTEAKTLFNSVRAPSAEEEGLGECIEHVTRDEADDAVVALLNPAPPQALGNAQVAGSEVEANDTPAAAREGAATSGNGSSESDGASDPPPRHQDKRERVEPVASSRLGREN